MARRRLLSADGCLFCRCGGQIGVLALTSGRKCSAVVLDSGGSALSFVAMNGLQSTPPNMHEMSSSFRNFIIFNEFCLIVLFLTFVTILRLFAGYTRVLLLLPTFYPTRTRAHPFRRKDGILYSIFYMLYRHLYLLGKRKPAVGGGGIKGAAAPLRHTCCARPTSATKSWRCGLSPALRWSDRSRLSAVWCTSGAPSG